MKYYLGIDIGSASSKAVVLAESGANAGAFSAADTGAGAGPAGSAAGLSVAGEKIVQFGTGSEGPAEAVSGALAAAGISQADISKTVATGYGRLMYEAADKQVTEISCHARAVKHLVPAAETVIDVGGQDAKVVRIRPDGKVENFVMNDKCAAGTGRFLEVMCRVFGVKLDELSALAAAGKPGVKISSTCTVFAESEVISQLSSGQSREDVACGVVYSIAEKIAGLAGRVGVAPAVVMSGGVALNESVVLALEKTLAQPITRLQDPQAAGALGAALYAHDLD